MYKIHKRFFLVLLKKYKLNTAVFYFLFVKSRRFYERQFYYSMHREREGGRERDYYKLIISHILSIYYNRISEYYNIVSVASEFLLSTF